MRDDHIRLNDNVYQDGAEFYLEDGDGLRPEGGGLIVSYPDLVKHDHDEEGVAAARIKFAADYPGYVTIIRFWSVAVYLIDQHYGGPEEGGWWYEAGDRIDDHAEIGVEFAEFFRLFQGEDKDAAYDHRQALQDKLDAGPNKNRRSDIGSVLSEGRYEAILNPGFPPEHWSNYQPYS